ncbi:hypothetical protein BsWGS_08839 [Bradybaena similaris]
MSLSRFSHFNNAVYSGSTNEIETCDSEEKTQLNDVGMIITAGKCTRSRCLFSDIFGSFSSVTVDGSGQIVRTITTVVRPDNAGSCCVHILPSTLKSLEEECSNSIGHMTVNIKQEKRHLELSISLPFCDDPYVDNSEVQESNIGHVTLDIEPENGHLGPSITLPIDDSRHHEEWRGRKNDCSCVIL